MRNPRNKKASVAENNPPAILCLPTPSPKNIGIKDNTNAYIMTSSQGRKRKAGNLAKNCPNHQSLYLSSAANQNENRVPQLPATYT